MKFQNCILINFERMHRRTDGWTEGQAQSNMPLQLFQFSVLFCLKFQILVVLHIPN